MAFNAVQMLILAAIFAFYNYRNIKENQKTAEYIFYESASAKKMTMDSFYSFYLLFNAFVPFEIMLSLQLIQILNITFIDNDTEMMYVD